MLVRDLMSHAPYVVRQDQLIELVAARMNGLGLSDAPVLDGRGAVVGMLSAEDLLRQWLPSAEFPGRWDEPETPGEPLPCFVGDIMRRGGPAARSADDAADVARIMVESDLRCVPVVDNGVLRGTVSRRDLMRTVLRTDETVRDEIQHRLDSYASGVRRWHVTVNDGVATVAGPPDDEEDDRLITIIVECVPGVRRARMVARTH
ncbi:hypothetical protein Val02_49800 [Virgisporangium aliadipatigenens]|uniref:CBS domain-containing protein n=1 Tax=Virgisporangium aliadipatigenens TaxID=741659 RepID=A0A8J3YM95_9ACTN|nr:CBS domain-containing protein [Virgisporangium aliadipatigenens]GIJ48094.1 hypothetical protein Val02_49800 [Virgisporangium aliadipatigenens]